MFGNKSWEKLHYLHWRLLKVLSYSVCYLIMLMLAYYICRILIYTWCSWNGAYLHFYFRIFAVYVSDTNTASAKCIQLMGVFSLALPHRNTITCLHSLDLVHTYLFICLFMVFMCSPKISFSLKNGLDECPFISPFSILCLTLTI